MDVTNKNGQKLFKNYQWIPQKIFLSYPLYYLRALCTAISDTYELIKTFTKEVFHLQFSHRDHLRLLSVEEDVLIQTFFLGGH